ATSAVLQTAMAQMQTEAERNRDGADAMGVLNTQTVDSLDTVSAVVEENTAATEQMAASSAEISRAIESVASVSEESSASVEEVSASAEEMSGQVTQVTLSANQLSQMAQELQAIVSQFRLPASSLADEAASVSGIAWDEGMASGDPLIDEQHRQLIDQINRLLMAMVEGRGRPEVEASLAFLETYVAKHFGYEESCMAKHNCPVAGKNKEAHTKFVASFRAMRSRIESEGPSTALAIELQHNLADWLVNHIRKIDTHLAGCLTQRVRVDRPMQRSGATPVRERTHG
ncbi:MAG TPA: bacteriohemerythrin, partial [Anaerolineales bacterium]|nr:bacteriohemerythrin [Anaerolineales bacterium]